MTQRLVLKDVDGVVVRSLDWDGHPATIIQRADNRRLEVAGDTEKLKRDKIGFTVLGEVSQAHLSRGPVLVGQLGQLSFVTTADVLDQSVEDRKDAENRALKIFAALLILCMISLYGVMQLPRMTPKMEEELKQQVVKIFQRAKIVPPAQKRVATETTKTPDKPNPVKARSPDRLKRLGALAILGNPNSTNKGGGLNLNAAVTSAGPGLGGSGGSGGVQTSLYAKGLTSAPLGPGGNIKGAGGYGTKGKGGGQDGYGKLSLVGSTGATISALGEEATVDEGLDQDAIREVIQRNMGQVRFCYEQGLQGDPTINGRVAVNFIINGQGLVRAASVEHTTLNAKSVEDCITMRLRTWKFPLPAGGVDVKVVFPFNLRRTGQG